MIIQAGVTASQSKKECEQLARRVFMIAEWLPHLQDPEVMRRPEVRRPLAGLGDTLREAHELVTSCQGRSAMYQFVTAGRQADRFRDVQSRIDSYLLVFPIISHIDITRRLDRICIILLPNDHLPAPSPSWRLQRSLRSWCPYPMEMERSSPLQSSRRRQVTSPMTLRLAKAASAGCTRAGFPTGGRWPSSA